MASINYATREISCKIVYYGPGLSGKTTNLQVIHRKIPAESKSEMVSLATETDRTLFFDFLPLDLGSIKGFATKFQLYTVPGQVYYNATRKLVLRGVDGVVFVADSQRDKMAENVESLKNLQENLKEYGIDLATVPFVLQYNKRDLPGIATVEELNAQVNWHKVPTYEAQAHQGVGVFTTLKAIGKIVIDTFNAKYSARQSSRRPSGEGGASGSFQALTPAQIAAAQAPVTAPAQSSPPTRALPTEVQQRPAPIPPPAPPMAPAPLPPQAAVRPPVVPPPAPLAPPPVAPRPSAPPATLPPTMSIPVPAPPMATAVPPNVLTSGFASVPPPHPASPIPGLQQGFFPGAAPTPVMPTAVPPQPLPPMPSVGGASEGHKKSRLDGTLDPSELDAEIARYERELAEQKPAPSAPTGAQRPIVSNPNVNPNLETDPALQSAFLSPDELSKLQGGDNYPTRRMPLEGGNT